MMVQCCIIILMLHAWGGVHKLHSIPFVGAFGTLGFAESLQNNCLYLRFLRISLVGSSKIFYSYSSVNYDNKSKSACLGCNMHHIKTTHFTDCIQPVAIFLGEQRRNKQQLYANGWFSLLSICLVCKVFKRRESRQSSC